MQIGGIPVDQLQRAFKGGKQQLTAFPADDGIPLPPTAPATILEVATILPLRLVLVKPSVRCDEAGCHHEQLCCAQDGTVVPPPVLEEGTVLLKEKRSWWPFAGQPKDEGGPFKPGGPGLQD